jgi:hypothetical protein
MQNHTTTAELATFSTAGEINNLIRQVFEGLPNNKHPVIAGMPRVVSRDEAELIMVAVDLHSLGLSPRAIRAVVLHPDAGLLHGAKRRFMIFKANGQLDFCRAPDQGPLDAAPLVIIDLRSVKARVDAAVEFAAVRRWGMERDVFKALPKTREEIKAARDAFLARARDAGEPV